jgi:translocation and assembly module TamB
MQATLRHEEAFLGRLDVSLTTDGSEANVEGVLVDTAGHTMKFGGAVPARLSIAGSDTALLVPLPGTVRAGLRGSEFDVGVLGLFLGGEADARLGGRLNAAMDLTGTREAPSVLGSIGFDGGSVDVPALGIRYRGVGFDVALEENRLVVSGARASTGAGALSAEGTITIENLGRVLVDLRCSAKGFELFRTADAAAVVDAELRLGGTPASPVLTGTVGLLEAFYQLPEQFGATRSDVQLTEEDWRMLEERFGYRRTASAGDSLASDPYTRSTLDLEVTMARNVWLRNRRNPKMELGMEGTLRVKKLPGLGPEVFGTLEPIPRRSFVEELGRRFKIVSGKVQIDGDPAEANVLIVADYDIPSQDRTSSSAVKIGLTVTMVDKKLDLAFSSDPAMQESEIITYLVTGKPSNAALAQAGDQGSIGASFALGQVVGSAEAITEGKIPLDVFQIQQDGARGVTVVAGSYVTPETYIGIRQPIALETTAQTSSNMSNVLELEVEYQILRWLLANVQGGTERVLAFLRFRHTY